MAPRCLRGLDGPFGDLGDGGAATAGCLLNVAVGRARLQHGGDASIPALVLRAADVQPTVSRRLFRRKAGQRESLF